MGRARKLDIITGLDRLIAGTTETVQQLTGCGAGVGYPKRKQAKQARTAGSIVADQPCDQCGLWHLIDSSPFKQHRPPFVAPPQLSAGVVVIYRKRRAA